MTEISEEQWRRDKYNKIEREADALGRVIGVRRLRPSESVKVTGYTPDLNGYDLIPDRDGAGNAPRYMPHRWAMMAAAAVCEISGDHIPFPHSRGELDAILNRLDMPGLEAAMTAFARFPDVEAVLKEEAKNSPGTPPSA